MPRSGPGWWAGWSVPAAGSPRRSAGGRRERAGGRRDRAGGVTKFTPLDAELHDYVVAHSRQDEVLREIAAEAAAMGSLADMQIAPDQGAFMTMLCRLLGAREAVELGTFTGYSAISIARGLEPGGRLLACELSEEYAKVAARNFERAGVADRIEIRIGPAAETLRALPEREVFDLAFIDADKVGYPEYYELVLPRTRPGGLILVDNVLADGRVVARHPDDGAAEQTEAIRRTNETIAADERVDAVMLAVADGIMLARKR
ncbi:MAG: SAM-dependent methyltransferase [Solirubrobacterales bacterium]|nr:SAM-dependent methyltransferase [Solirubrobacterales bacterium]